MPHAHVICGMGSVATQQLSRQRLFSVLSHNPPSSPNNTVGQCCYCSNKCHFKPPPTLWSLPPLLSHAFSQLTTKLTATAPLGMSKLASHHSSVSSPWTNTAAENTCANKTFQLLAFQMGGHPIAHNVQAWAHPDRATSTNAAEGLGSADTRGCTPNQTHTL